MKFSEQLVSKTDLKHAVQRLEFDMSVESRERRRRLLNPMFSIISDDCWGAEIYKDLGLPFATPLIGTYIMPSCFLKLASDCERILRSPMRFTGASKYDFVNEDRERRWFPTGVLADDVEVQFLHYASVCEVEAKWERRVARTAFNRLFFKLADKNGCTYEEIVRFDSLPIRKLVLSRNAYPKLPSVVTIPEFVADGKSMYNISLRHWEPVTWLNQA